jgi:4-amino-4-deoxy-L-arabinose transferase-like glycosyltransferase
MKSGSTLVPISRWILVAGIAAAFAILLFSLLVYCAFAFNLMQFPFDYDQGEGFELVDTILFSQGRLPYQNTDAYPFYSSNYPPLFHVMAAPFVWLFGPAYWYGRLLGFVGTLITAGVISWAVYQHGQQRWIALLAGLAFLSSNFVYHIGPLLRQHMTMVMFETLAVVVLHHAVPRQQRRWIWVGLLLLLAAGYTKQLAAITAAAALVWMALRNPRRVLGYGSVFALLGGAIFIWLTVATNGEWWRQAILANVNDFDPFQAFNLGILWWQLHAFLIVPALLMVIYNAYVERISIYSVWFVMALAFGLFSSGKWGGGDSYLATAIAAMCILSGIFFSRISRADWSFPERWQAVLNSASIRAALLVLIPVCYLAYGIATFKMPTDGAFFGTIAQALGITPNVMGRHFDSASYEIGGYANIGHFTTQQDIEAGMRIVARIRASEQPVLSEEAGFSLAAGHEVISNPTQLRNLWLSGMWNGDELLAMLRRQEFGLIILRAQFYPTPVLEAIGQHYTLSEVIEMNGFRYWIMEPA